MTMLQWGWGKGMPCQVGTFHWPLVHRLPWWTWSMDYLNGVPMDYPKWTTLKFVANMNLTMPEPRQKMQSINSVTNHLWCNRFNPQVDLCHKTLEGKTSGLRGQILASCPFAVYMRVAGVQVRDECDYICKISTYDLVRVTLGRLLHPLPTLFGQQ